MFNGCPSCVADTWYKLEISRKFATSEFKVKVGSYEVTQILTADFANLINRVDILVRGLNLSGNVRRFIKWTVLFRIKRFKMSITFDKAFEHTVGKEGGYSNHPSDRGGETMWGITIAVARDYGYSGSMRAMPIETAKEIYRRRYWDKANLTEIAKMSEPLAVKLFDIAVNMGVARAGIFFQTALNAFNQQEKLYNDILIDGDIGRNSLAALHSFYAKRGVLGSKVILRAINCLQGAFYIDISRNRKANEDFTFGWFANRID